MFIFIIRYREIHTVFFLKKICLARVSLQQKFPFLYSLNVVDNFTYQLPRDRIFPLDVMYFDYIKVRDGERAIMLPNPSKQVNI